MSVVDDPRTLGRARLSFANQGEIDDFVATLRRFEAGDISADEWKAYRLVRGLYGQRQPGEVQMLRAKVPQGILSAEQLRVLADVAQEYSRGFAHVTTRQNIQFHFVELKDAGAAMRMLAGQGLTTREACGNSVRNITACPYAGVSRDEIFDVTPYAEATTRYLLRHPLSSSMPRKFKIAFEGCPEDHAVTAINDLGFRARLTPDGRQRGFRVIVGGGTAIMCRSGRVLFDFVPAGEILNVAEAVIRVFHRLGDYKHRQRNRLKFLIQSLGWERWVEQVHSELEKFRAGGGAELPFDPERPPVESAPDWDLSNQPSPAQIADLALAGKVSGPGIPPSVIPVFPSMNGDFWRWIASNVRQQKQAGYCTVTATLPLGDFTSGQMRALAALAPAFGDGTVRVTPEQNLLFRWVPQSEAPELYRRLAAAGLGLPDAGAVADVISCPGAESCRLAVTQSRGLALTLSSQLREHPQRIADAGDLKIRISGCPNGCGQHHIAGIGLQGSVRRLGNKPVPQYFLMIGGGTDHSGAHFARLAVKIPARRVAKAVDRLITLYSKEKRDGEGATAFFRRLEVSRVKEVLGDLEHLTVENAVPEDFIDFGEEKEYVPEVLDGECAS
jgi:sulfite reductase (NADPH) hemoprotein beta-component